tara:strand:- start:1836 stop:2291 length:456 start_codon:yes stop_codon:yes gene_type:complete
MVDLKINVGGKNFFISCEAGQEEDLRTASTFLSNEVEKLKNDLGKIADEKILLMAALIITDKLKMKGKDLEKIKEGMKKVEDELNQVKEEFNILRKDNTVKYDYEGKLKEFSTFLDEVLVILDDNNRNNVESKNNENEKKIINDEKQTSLF